MELLKICDTVAIHKTKRRPCDDPDRKSCETI